MNDPDEVRAQYADESPLATRSAVWRPAADGRDPVELALAAVAAGLPAGRAMPDVLEVGAGPGVFAARFTALHPHVAYLATDASPRFVELCQERGLTARLMDAEELLAGPASYDVVVAMWMLYHVPDLDRALAELHRVLRPGARLGLLVLVARGEHANDLGSNSFPTDVELHRDLTTCGFRVLDRVDTAALAEAPPQWTTRADAVEEVVARRHRTEEAWRQAQQQTEILTRLLDEREVVSVLLSTERV